MAEDPSQIREAIEDTRAEIAETMEALGQKADVKGRLSGEVKEKADELKTTAISSAEQLKVKLATAQEQARSSLPESAYPAADAAMARVRETASSVSADPARARRLALAAGAVVTLLLLRRRRRRRRN